MTGGEHPTTDARERRLVEEMATIIERRWASDGASLHDAAVELVEREEAYAHKLAIAREGLAVAVVHLEALRMDTPEDERVRLSVLETVRLAERHA